MKFSNPFRSITLQDELTIQIEESTRDLIQTQLSEIRAKHETMYKRAVLDYLVKQSTIVFPTT